MLEKLKIIGPLGNLEAELTANNHIDEPAIVEKIAIICHPHPLQQGNMNNKVVTTLAKTFNKLDIPCIRFNYRGVGESVGTYGDMVGEVEDCQAVVDWVKSKFPRAKIILAGFSFGCYIAARTCADNLKDVVYLCTVAPSVERMPFDELPFIDCQWLIIMGEDDEVVRPVAVFEWYERLKANKQIIKFPGAKHFFHGKLVDLQNAMYQHFKATLL
jgi:alpha/beta superfamily hydrolase